MGVSYDILGFILVRFPVSVMSLIVIRPPKLSEVFAFVAREKKPLVPRVFMRSILYVPCEQSLIRSS